MLLEMNCLILHEFKSDNFDVLYEFLSDEEIWKIKKLKSLITLFSFI